MNSLEGKVALVTGAKIKFVDVSDTLMDMREVKTPEELALTRRAYTVF